MKRILFLILMIQTYQFCFLGYAETRFEKSSRKKQQIAEQIVWPRHEPLIFYLRRGRTMENWPEIYERQHAPENMRLMKEVGVRYGRLHFYKGFGLDMEMPEIRKSHQMADLMHKYGMKVSLYMAGTMFVETFYREVPEAKNWEQRDQFNRWVPYFDTQTFRHYACLNEPAYRDYIKKVIKIGIDSLKADQFFFDNIQLQPEPKSCRCPRCQRAFKEFLRRRYPTKEKVFRRFGYPDVDYIQINEWDVYNRPDDLTCIDDPVLQEWIRFRCESLANHCRDLAGYIKNLNPGISVGFNLKGLYGDNRIWLKAVYHPLYVGKCDFFPFDTHSMEARLDLETGALVSEIRSYKMARVLGMSCQHGGNDLEYAIHMAFNHQHLLNGYGYHGGPWSQRTTRSFTPLAEFFREYNDRYFTDTENIADVAVLRTWPSIAYSVWTTLVPTVLMEQVLIQHKVPFEIIFDEQINHIDQYRAIILAGQESLSQENIDHLLAYVRKGGTLIFTDNTADYNAWREKRLTNPLISVMGIHYQSLTTVRQLDKGKVVFIPKIEPTIPIRAGKRPFPSSQWVLPKNHETIYHAVIDNLAQGVSIITEAPLTTVMELLNRKKTKETIIHFVNFDFDKKLVPFRVQLKKQYKNKVKSIVFNLHEFDQPQKIKYFEKNGEMIFDVPSMRLYSMIIVSH